MMKDRKIVLKALVGSHNYNLATGVSVHSDTGIAFPASDKDYKVFILPTFEDLYNGEMYSEQIIGEKVDWDIHDIRKLSSILFKANINPINTMYP